LIGQGCFGLVEIKLQFYDHWSQSVSFSYDQKTTQKYIFGIRNACQIQKNGPNFFLSCLFSKIQKRAKYVVFFVENFISARNGEVFLRKFIKQTRMKMGKKIDFFGGPT
jgi:hypothetical protein